MSSAILILTIVNTEFKDKANLVPKRKISKKSPRTFRKPKAERCQEQGLSSESFP